jgi:hypothetical protein
MDLERPEGLLVPVEDSRLVRERGIGGSICSSQALGALSSSAPSDNRSSPYRSEVSGWKRFEASYRRRPQRGSQSGRPRPCRAPTSGGTWCGNPCGAGSDARAVERLATAGFRSAGDVRCARDRRRHPSLARPRGDWALPRSRCTG